MLKIASSRINYKLFALIPGLMGIAFIMSYILGSNEQVALVILGFVFLTLGLISLKFLKITYLVDYDREKNIVIIRKGKTEQFTLKLDEILNIRELHVFPIHSQGIKSSDYSQYGIIYKSEGKILTIPFIIYDNQSVLIENYILLRAKIVTKRHERIQSLKKYK